MSEDLIGAELDLAVALAVQGDMEISPRDIPDITDWYIPSKSWKQGGPLIEEYGINLEVHCSENGVPTSWSACFKWPMEHVESKLGPTPLIAAMRVLVASRTHN